MNRIENLKPQARHEEIKFPLIYIKKENNDCIIKKETDDKIRKLLAQGYSAGDIARALQVSIEKVNVIEIDEASCISLVKRIGRSLLICHKENH